MLTRSGGRRWAPVLLTLMFLGPSAAAAAAKGEAFTVTGTVRTASGRALAGATVAVEGTALSAGTDAEGVWRLVVPPGSHRLRVDHPGYAPVERPIDVTGETSGVDFVLSPIYRIKEDVVVKAVRADVRAPVTKKDIGKEEIEQLNYGQEMPFLLKATPSLTQYADTGMGAGYSYIYLRGIQQTRINMTLDGVPLSEPEDSALYFVDFGDFASSLESIQVQRGVGTSTVGAAAYAGSINFASVDLKDQRELDARLGLGSFGTSRASLGFQSGRFGPGLACYGRASYQGTDGFRDHSGVIQRSLFFGASHRDERSFFKLFGFAGRESTQLAFLAVEKDVLEAETVGGKDPLRTNPLSPAERDRFGQQFVQAQYTRSLGPSSSLSVQAYYNGAGGWYRLFSDETRSELWQYGLNWHFAGGVVAFHHARDRVSLTLGAHANDFTSRHTRDVVEGPRDYSNHNFKNEANAFAKLGYDLRRFHLYGDAQVRWARFRYAGDLDLGSVDWTFFNPKLGVRYDLTPGLGLYASVGRTTREPARADMLAGEDNASIRYDLRAVRPERVVDFEAGAQYRRSGLSLQADVYAMGFRNEIALTGELSEIGLPLRRNVDRSHRRGVELDLTWQARPKLRLTATANLSTNRIRTWTQFYDVYDTEGAYLGSTSLVHRDVRPLLTPPFVANLGLDASPASWFNLGVLGRYVDRSYLDNTDDPALTTPRFFSLDATATVALKRWIKRGEPRLRVQVTNVLDNRRLFPNGYSYLYFSRDARGGETLSGIPYLYPLATRAVLALLDLKL